MRWIRTWYYIIFGTLRFPSNHLSGTAAFLRSMLLYVLSVKVALPDLTQTKSSLSKCYIGSCIDEEKA